MNRTWAVDRRGLRIVTLRILVEAPLKALAVPFAGTDLEVCEALHRPVPSDQLAHLVIGDQLVGPHEVMACAPDPGCIGDLVLDLGDSVAKIGQLGQHQGCIVQTSVRMGAAEPKSGSLADRLQNLAGLLDEPVNLAFTGGW